MPELDPSDEPPKRRRLPPWFEPFVLQALSQAAGTLVAAAIIFLVGLAAGILDDVPVATVLAALGTVLTGAVAALVAATAARSALGAVQDLWTKDREAVAQVADALSGFEVPRLSDEQLQALGRLGGQLRIPDRQLETLRKAASAMGGLQVAPEQLEKLRALGVPVQLSDEQQKALRALSGFTLTEEQQKALAELGKKLREDPTG